MTSSEISTSGSTFRPWHFFVLGALVAATAAVVLVRPETPASLILLSLGAAAAASAGLALYRTLWPLVATEFSETVVMVGRRTRAALDREKSLVLRSIKELEFDHAMGKTSERDFLEMSGRLRARALSLMQQLDVDGGGYAALIEQEVRSRLARRARSASRAVDVATDPKPSVLTCGTCQTDNDPDARFCKRCGTHLEQAG